MLNIPVILQGSVIAVFNEAELRGIDLQKLEDERFTSRKHIQMVTEHRIRADWYRIRSAEIARPEKPPVKKKTKAKPQCKVEVVRKYLFTSEQVRIAGAIFRKEKK